MPTLTGTNNNDNLNGSSSSDVLYGNAGNDTLSGAGGNDTIYGGIGPTDPNDGSDTISGGDGNDLLYGNSGNDNVSGDAGNDTAFGGRGNDTLSGGSGSDVIYGNEDSDNINGGDGNDTIFGGATETDPTDAADTIYGSEGNDLVYGNGGNDVAYGNNGSDIIYGGSGNDTIYGGSSVIDGSDQADTIDGNEGNDIIYGNGGNDLINNTSGADIFYGGDGNDTINGSSESEWFEGGAGADRLVGNGGTDTASYATAPGSVTVNLNTGGTAGDASGDTYSGIENVLGSGYNDSLTGDSGNNLLDGSNGNDTLDGGAGLDTLQGGSGDDLVSYGSVAYNIQASLNSNTASDGDVYYSIEGLQGSQYNDTLTGNSANNTLLGGSGNDTVYGNGGSDTVSGDNGNDLLYGGSGENAPTDSADAMSGGAGNDIIYGNGGNDLIHGDSGQDTLFGGQGNDTIAGGSSDNDPTDEADVIDSNEGDDLVFGNGGNDTIRNYSGPGYAGGHDTIYGGYGNDTIAGGADSELIYGNQDSDNIQGGAGNDTIFGGNDIIDATDAADTIESGEGADIVYGNGGADVISNLGGGQDTIYGGTGNDSIQGWVDAEVLYGNEGSDTLTGGGGDDTFVVDKNSGDIDIVTDFNLAATFEKIDVRQFDTVNVFSDLTISQNNDGSASISLGDNQTLRLNNINASALSSKDFLGNWSNSKSLNIYNIGQLYDQVQAGDGSIPDYVLDKISNYTITDFDTSNPGNTDLYKAFNIIDISRFNVSSLSLTTQNGSTVVDLGAGRTLTIEGVTADKLTAGNFILNNADAGLEQAQTALLEDWRVSDAVKMGYVAGAQTITHSGGVVSYVAHGTELQFVNDSIQTNHNVEIFTLTDTPGVQVIEGFDPSNPYSVIDVSAFDIARFQDILITTNGRDSTLHLGAGKEAVVKGVPYLSASNVKTGALSLSSAQNQDMIDMMNMNKLSHVLANKFDPVKANYTDLLHPTPIPYEWKSDHIASKAELDYGGPHCSDSLAA